MHPDYDPQHDPQHDRRRKGAPDFDELHGFWHDKPTRAVSKFDRGFCNAIIITMLICLVVVAVYLMIDTAFADPRPIACRDAGAEIVACAQGLR